MNFLHQSNCWRRKIQPLQTFFGWLQDGDARRDNLWSISADAIFARPRSRRKTQCSLGGPGAGHRENTRLAQSLGHPRWKSLLLFHPLSFLENAFGEEREREMARKVMSELRMTKKSQSATDSPWGRSASCCVDAHFVLADDPEMKLNSVQKYQMWEKMFLNFLDPGAVQ